MKNTYSPMVSAFDMEALFHERVDIPETATVKQLQEFSEVIDGIVVNPIGLISEAFERIFDLPFDDGTEEDQVKCQDVQLDEVS